MERIAAALEVTCDEFPFELYYVRCYDRMRHVRTAVRICLADYTQEDGYRRALLEIEAILADVMKDKNVRNFVKRLKEYYKDFLRLRKVLESDVSQKKWKRGSGGV